MLKKLLYLYNDGHTPFEGEGGLGYKPRMYGRGWLEDFERDEAERALNPEFYHGGLDEEGVLTIPFQWEHPLTTFGVEKYEDLDDKNKDRYKVYKSDYDKYITQLEEETGEQYNEYDEEEDLLKINKNIEEAKKSEIEMLGGKTVEQIQKEIDKLETKIKDEKKNIIKKNLELSQVVSKMKTKAIEDKESFMKQVSKGKVKKLTLDQVQEAINEFIDEMLDMELNDINTESVLRELLHYMEQSNVDKKHLQEMKAVATMIASQYLAVYSEKGFKDKTDPLTIIADCLFKLAYPDLRNSIDSINSDKHTIEKNINKLAGDRAILNHKLTHLKYVKDIIKEEQQAYNDRLQYYKRKNRNKRDKLRQRIIKTEEPELGAEEPETKEKKVKPKKEKAVKKSEEETQAELFKADVSGRLKTIDSSMSSNGKDLEKYLSGNGQTILQFITGDKSQVYDNEFNEAIPNITITLNTGQKDSLRRATTLDLYNNDNVFEIKNYKEYSINDKVIPIQETKLEGTGYFIPYYLQNGKLYNIELNYIDPGTGINHTKFILPLNPNGRELNLIYRLKEGIYEFKPLEDKTNYVALKKVPLTTPEGKSLYKFNSTTFKPCVDHHGNPSFNIKPFLRKIKTK
jgi:hypothetical protein